MIQMPSMTRWTVEVSGRPRTHYDNMMDALTAASHALYMGPDTYRAATNALRNGRTFDFAYGFTDATIYPPGKLVGNRND